MIIAIQETEFGFSSRWIDYCVKNNISYKLVNSYQYDIVNQLKGCDIFLWGHHHADYKDALFAKQLLFSLQSAGKKVFPDFNTNWHFDDKVGQKYLLEAIGAPIVPTYVFYSKKEALNWINTANFPIVFKLRGGAGSTNVKLIRTKSAAKNIINKAFSTGFSQFDRIGNLKERYRKFKIGKDNIIGIIKGIGRLFITTNFDKMHGKEKGYVYFQDYIEGHNFDIRVIVTGDKAFAIKRYVRKNDFRASGSGHIVYAKSEIDERCIMIAFEVNKTLKAQSIAFDFVFNKINQPLIVEISYGYDADSYNSCQGYWDSNLKWHEEKFNAQAWIIENLINMQ